MTDTTTTLVRTALLDSMRDYPFQPTDVQRTLVTRVVGPMVTIEHDADATPQAIAEQVWAVANRQARDANGYTWPSNVRSFSVGDALVINGQVFTAEFAGFHQLPRAIHSRKAIERFIRRRDQDTYGPWRDNGTQVDLGMTDQEGYAFAMTSEASGRALTADRIQARAAQLQAEATR